LTELVEFFSQAALAGFIEVKAKVVNSHEGSCADASFQSIPFCQAQSSDERFFLPFTGKETGVFPFNEQ
jgi:hypothetical protein